MRTACVCLLEVTRAQRGSSPRRQECCCRLGTASSRYGLSSSWYGTACWRSRGPRGALLGVRSLSSSTPSLDRLVRDLLCVGKWTPDAFPRRDRSQGLSSSSPVLCHEGPEELSSCVLFPVRDREGGGLHLLCDVGLLLPLLSEAGSPKVEDGWRLASVGEALRWKLGLSALCPS